MGDDQRPVTEADDPRDRGARAVLFDDRGRLVVIRRTRPGGDPYLVCPGGGVRTGETWEQAVTRECREELGAGIVVGPVAWVVYRPEIVQRFFVARLVALDTAARTGHEFSEPWRGTYETVRLDLGAEPEALDDLRPSDLAEVLRTHAAFLADESRAI